MTINPKTKEEVPKSIIDLNENELFYNSFVYNYLNSPTDIAFQTINYSDKSTIINQIFNREELFELINKKVPENYKKAPRVEKIKQVYYNHNKGIAQSLAHNIFKDLNYFRDKMVAKIVQHTRGQNTYSYLPCKPGMCLHPHR